MASKLSLSDFVRQARGALLTVAQQQAGLLPQAAQFLSAGELLVDTLNDRSLNTTERWRRIYQDVKGRVEQYPAVRPLLARFQPLLEDAPASLTDAGKYLDVAAQFAQEALRKVRHPGPDTDDDDPSVRQPIVLDDEDDEDDEDPSVRQPIVPIVLDDEDEDDEESETDVDEPLEPPSPAAQQPRLPGLPPQVLHLEWDPLVVGANRLAYLQDPAELEIFDAVVTDEDKSRGPYPSQEAARQALEGELAAMQALPPVQKRAAMFHRVIQGWITQSQARHCIDGQGLQALAVDGPSGRQYGLLVFTSLPRLMRKRPEALVEPLTKALTQQLGAQDVVVLSGVTPCLLDEAGQIAGRFYAIVGPRNNQNSLAWVTRLADKLLPAMMESG